MESFLLLFVGLVGAAIGSFLNVVILRLPTKDASIVFPGSHCPQCDHPLAWYDNVPILSFILLAGKCRYCRSPISWQYPLVESAMAILSICLYRQFGISLEMGYYFLFTAALVVIIFIDIRHQIIPDSISLPGIAFGFAGSFFIDTLTWQQSLIGLLLGGGVLYAIALIHYMLTKREGMGGGDIKLLAMIGAFLGWKSLLYVVFSSSILGSLVGVIVILKRGQGKQTRIPFGPFLAFGALSYLFLHEHIMAGWHAYLQLLG
ncbi:MAG: prepilin peptidase [Desulfobulbus sp.]|jgi:leader peptidase (prepilin peptidase)/N-methyltransferase